MYGEELDGCDAQPAQIRSTSSSAKISSLYRGSNERVVLRQTGIMGPIAAWEENLLGKQFPTFCPLGPAIVTADEIPDPRDVHIQTRLNGTVAQDAHTSDLVFGVAELIAYYSRFYALRPGDVISTGSPSGVGFARDPKVFMRPGDIIEVESPAIGTLRNYIATQD